MDTDGLFFPLLDPYANPEPRYGGAVHRPDERGIDYLPHRGLADTLEGRFECDCRRRYVY